jgi:16S rRNA (guanine966-N2)-methyltransferase
MRIIGGKYKRRRLKFVKTLTIRPTMDRVRESLFNVLGDTVEDAEILDIFAGFGSLGLEALSRGAEHCTFIDNSRQATEVLKENIQTLALEPRESKVLPLDWQEALTLLKNQKRQFNLVFLDPPYNVPNLSQNVLLGLAGSGIVRPSSWVICEHSNRDELKNQMDERVKSAYSVRDERKFGQTYITILEARG